MAPKSTSVKSWNIAVPHAKAVVVEDLDKSQNTLPVDGQIEDYESKIKDPSTLQKSWFWLIDNFESSCLTIEGTSQQGILTTQDIQQHNVRDDFWIQV